MKIDTTQMYRDYNETISFGNSSLTEENLNLNRSKEYLLNKLSNFEHYIKNFTNIDYKKISELNKPIDSRAIRTFSNPIGLDIDVLKRSINGVIEINRTINTNTNILNKSNSLNISETIFKEILYKFNNKVSNEIITKGYSFRPGFALSEFRIKKILTDRRIKKRINWGESNKLKAEIIARGEIPFKVLTKDEFKRPVTDNGGVKWFVYFNTLVDYLWHWNKKQVRVTNSAYYRFRPTIYNNTSKGGKLGNVNKLKNLVMEDSELLKNFSL